MTRGQNVKSRGEREIWNSFLQFREEKEKFKIICHVSRREREICQEILWEILIFSRFREEKENSKILSPISRGEGEKWKEYFQFREEKEKFKKQILWSEKRKSYFFYFYALYQFGKKCNFAKWNLFGEDFWIKFL